MSMRIKLIAGVCIFFFSLFAVFKLTTYFYVDAGYNGVVANQYNYSAVLELLEQASLSEAEEYLRQLIQANEDLLRAALEEKKVSPETTKKIIKVLEKRNKIKEVGDN